MHVVVFVTVPSEEVAKKIARHILEARLAACVNICKDLTSMYWWEDKIQEEPESLMIIKTKSDIFPRMEEAIRSIHPYTVPEIISLPIICGYKQYLDWIDKETQSPSNSSSS